MTGIQKKTFQMLYDLHLGSNFLSYASKISFIDQ